MNNFRIWDNKYKFFYDLKSILLAPDGDVYSDTPVGLRKLADVTVQFNTGAIDKNGKKIYEGDIIRESYDRLRGYLLSPEVINDKNNPNNDKSKELWIFGNFSYISEVIWCDTYHSFLVNRSVNGKKELDRCFPLNGSNIEIIGNIFETPELLK